MTAFHPPKARIDAIAGRLANELTKNPNITVENPGEVSRIFRRILTENLQEEHELDEEVLKMLQQHGQKIFQENADFHKLLMDGKRILAKKKGFVL